MPHPLNSALAFLLLTLTTLWVCDRLVDACVDRPAERRYEALLAGTERFEAIVIGSSHTEFGVDVAALEAPGLRPYNFANSHSGPLYFEPWYSLFARLNGPARLVIVGADWAWTHQPATLASDADALPTGAWLALIRGAPHQAQSLLTGRFALVKEQGLLVRQLFGVLNRVETDMARYYRGGSPLVPKPYRDSPGSLAQQARAPDAPGAWEAFERLCQRLGAEGTRVVFVQIPEYLPVSGAHPQENARIAALADQHGWPFLNYNAELASGLNRDQSLFADWGHLNAHGRARFSQALRGDLERLGAMPAPQAGR